MFQYELLISTANSAQTINTIVGTQLLQSMQASACVESNTNSTACGPNYVDVDGVSNYLATNGPTKFSNYTYLIIAINLAGTLVFTQFLPQQKEQCHEWRREGEKRGASVWVGVGSAVVAVSVIGY